MLRVFIIKTDAFLEPSQSTFIDRLQTGVCGLNDVAHNTGWKCVATNGFMGNIHVIQTPGKMVLEFASACSLL